MAADGARKSLYGFLENQERKNIAIILKSKLLTFWESLRLA